MMNKELLQSKIRPVTDKDRESLPKFSYSKMDLSKQCMYRYNLQYNLDKRSQDTTLALQLGTLCHWILEQKGKMLVKGEVDYSSLIDWLENGVIAADEKTNEEIPGTKALSKKYFDEWYVGDNASGMSYVDKLKVFDKVVHTEMESSEWKPYLFEHNFEFVYDDKVIIHGFIDRIDRDAEGNLRTIDYKTSKKAYDTSKLSTSLQFGVYALAILNEFDQIPVESLYRFILIDDTQKALSLGWEKRLIKAMDKIFAKIDSCGETNKWEPKPTPLCYWCPYCRNNPQAEQYADECEYFSLWTPTRKTFEVNEKYNPVERSVKKRLIF